MIDNSTNKPTHITSRPHTLQTCGRVLLPEADRRAFLRAMRSPHADALRKAAIFKKVVDKCKKASFCFECKAVNGKVRAWIDWSPCVCTIIQ